MHSISRTLAAAAVVLAVVAAPVAQAQTAAAPAAAASAPVKIDAEKQKLIDKLLSIWHPENEVIVRAQQLARDTMEKSLIAMQTQRVPEDKIKSTMLGIRGDAEKYISTVTPVVTASATKNVGPVTSQILAQTFTNDELKQLISFFESNAKAKFEKVAPSLQKAVDDKVTAEVGAQIDKESAAMAASAGTKLRAAVTVK